MAGSQKKSALIDPDEALAYQRETIGNWIDAVKRRAGEGRVENYRRPDAWAVLIALSAIAAASAMAFALFDRTESMGAGTILGLLAIALVLAGLRNRLRTP